MLRGWHFQSIEIGVKVNDSIPDKIIRTYTAIHELNLETSAEMLIATIDHKLEFIFKFRVYSSFLDDLTFFVLVGEFEDDVGVHGREFTGLMLDVGLLDCHLEYSKDGLTLGWLGNISLGTSATHYNN